jgi:DNA polymerase bacteriophage-type
MPILFRDYETRSALDLSDVGAWRYSTDSSTDIWCCAFAIDDGEIKLWTPGYPVPKEFVEAARNPDWLVTAFNDQFERYVEQHILGPRYGFPTVPTERHRCLQASAAAHALPASLKGVAEALKLGEQKDDAGRRTMLAMAKPRKPRQTEDPAGVYWFDDPERRETLYTYCKQDVATERELYRRIGFLSKPEQALWILDQIINDRGIHLDQALIKAAIKITEQAQTELNAELAEISSGKVQSVHQHAALLAWLVNDGGCKVDAVDKTTLKRALTRKDLDSKCRRVIELRLEGGQTASSKFDTMLNWIGSDNRARGCFKYHGASTGRWTSHGIQVQNMKRPDVEDVDAAIAAVATGDLVQMRERHPQPLSVVGDTSRAMITAAPGHRFIAADFSGIESRVTAFLSGQQSKLNQWRKFDQTGALEDDPYYVLGLKLGIAPENARAIGKTADLAFGFNGGKGAWLKMAPDDSSTEEQIEQRKNAWRAAHPYTVELWRALDRAAVKAVQKPCETVKLNRLAWKHLSFKSDGLFLRMTLPSGRSLAYPEPSIKTNERDNPIVSFLEVDGRNQWGDCRHGHGAWPGLWIENAVQAVARDLLAAAMGRLEAAGYQIVLHVHDEIVAEVPEGFGSTEEFLRIITKVPAWATGLPIAAKVREGLRFCKSKAKPAEPPPFDPDLVHARDEELEQDDPIKELTSKKTEAPAAEEPKPNRDNNQQQTNSKHRGSKAETERDTYAEENADEPFNDSYLIRKGYSLARVFDYTLPDGTVLYRQNRYELRPGVAPTKKNPRKRFLPHRTVNGKEVFGADDRRVIYNWPAVMRAGPDSTVLITEGEANAKACIEKGLLATTVVSHKWTAECTAALTGYHAIVLEDHDESGIELAADAYKRLLPVAASIRVVPTAHLWKHLPHDTRAIKPHDDVKDWLELGGDPAKLLDICREIAGKPTIESVWASDIKPTTVKWLWPGRFALGKLGIIAGLPDEGKGLLFHYIIARITCGRRWPCGEGTAPLGNVILLTAEDDLKDTVIPRLTAAGADLGRVKILRMVPNGSSKRMFSLVTDLEMLRQTIDEMGNVQAIFIDPITAYLGVKQIDSFRTTDVRAVLAPMVDLASEQKVLILALMHFNKKLDVTNVLLRISDSLAFAATSRHCYAVVYDAENKRSLLVRGKNNLAPKDQKALAFNIELGDGGIDPETGAAIEAPYIIFAQEPVDVTASEAMQAASENKTPGERDKAKQILFTMLSDGQEMLVDEIKDHCEGYGISWRTMRRAADDLKVIVDKDRTTPKGKWFWKLPPKESLNA